MEISFDDPRSWPFSYYKKRAILGFIDKYIEPIHLHDELDLKRAMV
jgi:hypothetical protein